MPEKFREKLKFRLFFFLVLLCKISAKTKNLYTLGISVIKLISFLRPIT